MERFRSERDSRFFIFEYNESDDPLQIEATLVDCEYLILSINLESRCVKAFKKEVKVNA